MHHAWEIPELVDKVVGHIPTSASYVNRTGLATLAVLARTATIFEQPAYARLYETLRGASLDALACRVVDVSGTHERDAHIRKRCLTQAGLVQSVDLVSWRSSNQCDSAIFTLNFLREPLYPFPSLKTLGITAYSTNASFQIINLLLCPTLKTLHLTINSPGDRNSPGLWKTGVLGLLAGLSRKACNISTLSFSTLR